jgi:hypothetical protein
LLDKHSPTWNPPPVLFALFCLFVWNSLVFMRDPPIYASHIAGITGACHWVQLLIGWDGVLWSFCPGWSWTTMLPISTSQVTGIPGMRHHIWLKQVLLHLFLFMWCLGSVQSLEPRVLPMPAKSFTTEQPLRPLQNDLNLYHVRYHIF